MDELSEKLSGLLNDPESMERVKQMAESILGGAEKEQKPDIDNSVFGSDDLQSIISIISRLKAGGNDPRTNLLNALKPHLSEPRREKVDTAIKILKVIELLPLMRDSGILKL